ncbi:TPA: glycosyltransferase family 2 protein, partial [Candidatus Collierbacteria bacterium]|nr:glycosyltransferase family 2 protein [Candidatus Collierbacteria bacterium]
MSPASPLSKVVIIIPTYNEAGNVKAVTQALHKIFKQLKSYSCQILFVDDNSPDGTSKIVSSLARRHPFVHLLLNKRKGGLGHAYKKGMLYALDRMKADIIFEFDADLSHDPTKIPAMLVKLEQGADLVLGSRYIPGGSIPEHWGFHRKFLSVGGNLFIQFIMLNRAIRDWTTGYRA